MQIVNVSGYYFEPLDNLQKVKQTLLNQAKKDLKGTVLLSHEGINVMLAGAKGTIEHFKKTLASVNPSWENIFFKESFTDDIPFKFFKVKIRKEAVTFGVDDIIPNERTGKYLAPKDLQQWLDENKDITFIDTRNDYELAYGKFKQALDLNIKTFRDLPDAITAQELDKDKPVVMYCTGGIRCEKASAYMMDEGFKEVYQLDGGIINYFEQCGESHYQGDCFVFDDRISLKPDLTPSTVSHCVNCRWPLEESVQACCTHCGHQRTTSSG